MNDDLTEVDKEWMKAMGRLPKDAQQYVRELHSELEQCYEYMRVKEEQLRILEKEWEKREGIHNHFKNLMFQLKLKIEFKKPKRKKQ